MPTQNALSTTAIRDLCRLPGATLTDWIEKGIVTPVAGGEKGRGHTRLFSFTQAVGLMVASQLRASERGCHPSYIAQVVTAFASLTVAELQTQIAQDGPHFVGIVQGKPVLRAIEYPEWPNVERIAKQVSKLAVK